MDVVEDDDARPVGRQEPVEVGGGDLDEGRGRLGRVGRHIRRLRLPAGEGRVARDGRDRAAVAPDRRWVRPRSKQQLPDEGAGVDAVLVGDGLREERARTGTAHRGRRTTFSVQVQAKPSARASASTSATQPRLAHPRVADSRARPRRDPMRLARAQRPADDAPISAARPTSGASGCRPAPARAAQAELAGQRVQPHHRRLAAQDDRARGRRPRDGRGRRGRSPRRAGSRPAGRATGCARRS